MARNNTYNVNRPNYKARMEANEYRDYLNEKRKETSRLKKIETDNLYNENTFGGNVWRNTKKFASIALPALIGYGLLKGKHVGLDSNDGMGMFALKTLGAGLSALPATAAATAIGVVPYTYLRQMEAENSRRDEAYEQFKHMQNKVLAQHNLLNYQAPKSNLPGSTFFPRNENEFGYRNKRSGDYSALEVVKHVGGTMLHGAGNLAVKASNVMGSPYTTVGLKSSGVGAAMGLVDSAARKKLSNTAFTKQAYEDVNNPAPGDESEHEEVLDLKNELESIKNCCRDEYELKLERALDTLSEEDRQKLLDLLGPYEAKVAEGTPCLDKILNKSFSENKIGENANAYAAVARTPNWQGPETGWKQQKVGDEKTTVDFRNKEIKKNGEVVQATKTTTVSQTATAPQSQVSYSAGIFSEHNALSKLLHKDFDDKNLPAVVTSTAPKASPSAAVPHANSGTSGSTSTSATSGGDTKPNEPKPVENKPQETSSESSGKKDEDPFGLKGLGKTLGTTSKINAGLAILEKVTANHDKPARWT